MSVEDRLKSTVLSRVQRIEHSVYEMRQSIDNVSIQMRSIDEKLQIILQTPQSTSTSGQAANVHFSTFNLDSP